VLIAQEVKGGAMLAPFFNQLAQGSAAQSRQLNQANIRWSEAQQRSPQFNEAICQALAAAVAEKK
ncbi:peptidase, partial [Klebsiella pneumoniae]